MNWGIFTASFKPKTMIIAFAGSNSSTSINFKLVRYTCSLLGEREYQLLNMANFPFPMYSADYEKERGFSNSLMELRDDIKKAVGIIISVNEHNGNPSSYFKNLIDWLSRLEREFLKDKKIMLMAASPGARGGVGALDITEKLLPRFGAEVISTFSLPGFYENFDEVKGIKDDELASLHRKALNTLLEVL